MSNFAAPRQVAATASANATLAKGKHTPVNASSGARTMTLPAGTHEGSVISVEKVDSSTNAVAVTGSIRGVAAQTISLVGQYECITFTADSAGSWWPTAGHKTKAWLDATYVGSTTIRTIVQITAAAYSALATPDPTTLYVVVG